MKKILYFFMAAVLFCSCEKEEVNIVDTAKLVSSLKHKDIADAQSLFIATSSLTRGGAYEEENFHGMYCDIDGNGLHFCGGLHFF